MVKVKLTIADYRKLESTKLAKELSETRLKLQDLRNQLVIGKLKNHQEINNLRRAIARMETARGEKIMLEVLQHGEN